ncbi:unnamed protein product [Caenorhabditis angaria]|uniref:Uncharacterized protein n=1 Tax=Caenorhabditis angaria TaxID=860376 RepID=A0A9P1N405_9PELO|nr:unnamed protein product [Caenorhabditis angaria]
MLILILGLICVVNCCNIRPETIKCDEGWTPIQRKLGGWCVKIKAINTFPGETSCYVSGGSDMGVESSDELTTYMSMMKEMSLESVLIGGRARADCYCEKEVCNITENCQIPSVWRWNDGFLVGTEMLNTVTPQFKSENMYGVYLVISVKNDIGLIDIDYNNGLPSYFFCGKKSN